MMRPRDWWGDGSVPSLDVPAACRAVLGAHGGDE